jgi:hypothetical protein
MCVVLLMSTLLGCGKSGPKALPVTGKVTCQGKPVSAASIRFSNPQAGVDLLAKLDADGKYAVVTANGPGLPEGTYQVAIVPDVKNAPVGTFGTPPAINRPDIPEKYRSPTTSELSVTVKSAAADFNVDMRPNP